MLNVFVSVLFSSISDFQFPPVDSLILSIKICLCILSVLCFPFHLVTILICYFDFLPFFFSYLSVFPSLLHLHPVETQGRIRDIPNVENGFLTHKDLLIYVKQRRSVIKPTFQKITLPAQWGWEIAGLTVRCKQFNSEVMLAWYSI